MVLISGVGNNLKRKYMKREIKFKAKKFGSKDWIKGSYVHTDVYDFIAQSSSDLEDGFDNKDTFNLTRIIPNTLCQYTGFKDKNGVEIYEGDVFLISKDYYGIVSFDKKKALFYVLISSQNDKFEDNEDLLYMAERYCVNEYFHDQNNPQKVW